MSEWISVKDKLPEPGVNVVVFLKSKPLRVAHLYRNTKRDVCFDGIYCWYVTDNDYETLAHNEVSHWHSLGELPQ